MEPYQSFQFWAEIFCLQLGVFGAFQPLCQIWTWKQDNYIPVVKVDNHMSQVKIDSYISPLKVESNVSPVKVNSCISPVEVDSYIST